MSDKKRVLLDKKVLDQYVAGYQLERDLDTPELVGVMKGKTFIRVRGASLNDHIAARELSSAPALLLATVLNEVSKGNEVDAEVIQKKIAADEMIHPNANFEIDMFRRCVIEPKFSMPEVIKLSETMPEFVNRVVTEILGITVPPKE